MDTVGDSPHNHRMCPACAKPLVVFELDGVEIDRCLACRGTWLDAGELDQLCRLDGVKPGALTAAIFERGGARDGSRKCVRCGAALRIVDVQGVEIDHCGRGHGLWFDSDELEALIGKAGEGEAGAAARFFAGFLAAERKKRGS